MLNVYCETDPNKSKVVNMSGGTKEIVFECMNEVLGNLELNIIDLPFYAAALEFVKLSLLADMDDKATKKYQKIIRCFNVTNFHPIIPQNDEEEYEEE